MMNKIVFYKMKLGVDEDGISIITNRFISIHETEQIHFCVTEFAYRFFNKCFMDAGETEMQYAKRTNKRVYKIYKSGSRIAFSTEEKALEHLLWMKKLQIKHLKAQLELNQKAIEAVSCMGDLKPVKNIFPKYYIVNGTQDFVQKRYAFQ